MPLTDNDELRDFLSRLYPGLIIEGTPSPSGQRVVYFCHFDPSNCFEPEWISWGNVVLKISEGVSAQSIAYIQKEIEILEKINHPGYPKLLLNEVITEDPETEERFPYRRFITIEGRIDAKPLSEIKDQFNIESAVIRLLTDLLVVLNPLWASVPPLIHRDLKPENILITPDGNVVVIDLGIAREEGGVGVTVSAYPFGPCTPKYASPEQARNDKRNITFKSDLFSLGVICYELLSGAHPFSKDTNLLDGIFDNVINFTPPPLFTEGFCSEGFSNIIEIMMEKQPYKRYRRLNDLINDINSLGED